MRDRPIQVDAGVATAFAADQQVIDEVYRRRARRLAQRRTAYVESRTFGVLLFGLGAERYAIELADLLEVFPYRGCTSVPGCPPALLGVINVRGEIRPVADLRRILELPPKGDDGPGYVLMLRRDGRATGLRVDTIDQVRQLDRAYLLPVADGAAPIPGSRFVKALTADATILIDVNAVLSHLAPASHQPA